MLARLRTRWLALPPAGRAAVGVWAALLAGVAGRVAVSSPWAQTVLPVYLAAGDRWRAGADLYAPLPGLDIYRNPPGVAAGFAALSPLPPKAAGLVWRAAGAAVFLLGLGRFRRHVAPDLSPTRAGAMFALAAVLALPAVNNGQVNLLLAGAGLHAMASAARGRWWAAAGWFAAAGWLKVYPLAVGLLAAVAAPLRLGPKLLLATAAGFAGPFLLQDPGYVLGQYRGFVAYLGTDDRSAATDWARVPFDWTIVPRATAGWVPSPRLTTAVSLAAAVGAAAAVGRERWPAVLVRALALGSVWMTAFGPATEANTYAALAGVAAYLAVAPGPRWAVVTARVGAGLLVAAVVRFAFPPGWPIPVSTAQPVGAVLLAAAAAGNAASRGTAPAARRDVSDVSGAGGI